MSTTGMHLQTFTVTKKKKEKEAEQTGSHIGGRKYVNTTYTTDRTNNKEFMLQSHGSQ
jgi:hypothetical protein